VSSTDIRKHDWEGTGLVPPRRLGALLSSVRAQRGVTLDEVVERSQGVFTLSTIASIERGTTYVTDEELAWIAALYDVETTKLIPSRSQLVIDLDDGRIEIEGQRRARVAKDADRREVLARYLATVYSMRGIELGTPITLRLDDLEVLGRALHLEPTEAAADLDALMATPDDLVASRHRQLRRKVLLPAAGVLVALVAAGTLVLIDRNASADIRPTAPTSTLVSAGAAGGSTVAIDHAVVQERNPDGTPGPVVVRNN